MKPFLSIVIPVYNVAFYLRRCLDSVRAQTMTDWEAICIDDGSRDESGCILDEYAKFDTRFKVVHQENQGVSRVRQIGIDRAEGMYLGFVDADDWVDPDYFGALICAAKATGADMVYCGYEREKPDGRTQVVMQKYPTDQKSQVCHQIVGDIHGSLWTRLFRIGFIRANNVLFPQKRLEVREDLWFVLTFLSCRPSVAYVAQSGYHYCLRKDSATRQRLTARLFEQHVDVAEYIASLFPESWAQNSVQRFRQGAFYGGYLEPGIDDNSFFSRLGEVPCLRGSRYPLHHKIMFWLAVRGLRQPLIWCVGLSRKIRKLA